jgi:choline dehydrogenase-like flavoprotein
MRDYNYMLTARALIEDQSEGRVVLGLDREPYLVFRLGKRDVEKIHRGVGLTAELLFAAGARRVLLPFGNLQTVDKPEDLPRISERPAAAGTIALTTEHLMGTTRMAPRPRRGATDTSGGVHGVDGLVVADASVLPSSLGVNPQETIVAMALRNADRWIDRVGERRRRGTVQARI